MSAKPGRLITWAVTVREDEGASLDWSENRMHKALTGADCSCECETHSYERADVIEIYLTGMPQS